MHPHLHFLFTHLFDFILKVTFMKDLLIIIIRLLKRGLEMSDDGIQRDFLLIIITVLFIMLSLGIGADNKGNGGGDNTTIIP